MFLSFEQKLCRHWTLNSLFPAPSLWFYSFIFVKLSPLGASYEWNHSVFVLLWLAAFTQHNVLRVHPCCSRGRNFLLRTPHSVHPLICWTLGLLLPFGCCQCGGLLSVQVPVSVLPGRCKGVESLVTGQFYIQLSGEPLNISTVAAHFPLPEGAQGPPCLMSSPVTAAFCLFDSSHPSSFEVDLTVAHFHFLDKRNGVAKVGHDEQLNWTDKK